MYSEKTSKSNLQIPGSYVSTYTPSEQLETPQFKRITPPRVLNAEHRIFYIITGIGTVNRVNPFASIA